jgi:hypothetical protein
LGTLVSSTNKTDHHDITEILLKVALNTTKPNQTKLLDDKYHFSKRTSSILAGAVYDVSMIVSPFLGGLIVSSLFILNSFYFS